MIRVFSDSSPQLMTPDSDSPFKNVPNESGVKSHDSWFVHSLGGGEDYHRLRPICYPNTDVFLLCFSVDNRDSFRGIGDTWHDRGNLVVLKGKYEVAWTCLGGQREQGCWITQPFPCLSVDHCTGWPIRLISRFCLRGLLIVDNLEILPYHQ